MLLRSKMTHDFFCVEWDVKLNSTNLIRLCMLKKLSLSCNCHPNVAHPCIAVVKNTHNVSCLGPMLINITVAYLRPWRRLRPSRPNETIQLQIAQNYTTINETDLLSIHCSRKRH